MFDRINSKQSFAFTGAVGKPAIMIATYTPAYTGAFKAVGDVAVYSNGI